MRVRYENEVYECLHFELISNAVMFSMNNHNKYIAIYKNEQDSKSDFDKYKTETLFDCSNAVSFVNCYEWD